MTQRRSCAAALLLLASAGLVMQALAMPMHPDLLSFVKLPTASLEEELQQTAGRKLQQQQGDLFQENGGPFTFDGFGPGYGGLFPGGGFFNGFGVNIYNIIFRDVLNEGLNQYLARGIDNTVQPFDFIVPEVGKFFNRDVVALFGYDAVDKFVGQYLTRAEAKLGKLVDAGCVGPTYSATINGGECEISDEDGSVECEEPFIELSSTPYICNLPFRGQVKVEGQSYKYSVKFGKERSGEIGLPAGEYNFGAAVNVTTPFLGLSLATAQLADDFGVQQWYQFVGNLILNELLRIQGALLSGVVDSRILTRAAQQQAATTAPRSDIASGVAAVADAGSMLLDKIASNMGINTADLTAGLKAAGVLPQPAPSPAPASAPQQPAAPTARSNGTVSNVANTAEGENLIVKNTDTQQGDQALLGEPAVMKAEGAQPTEGRQPAAAP